MIAKNPLRDRLFAPLPKTIPTNRYLPYKMLIIRQAQMGAMREYMLERFVAKMVSHLRVTYPDYAAEQDDDIERFVREGIREGNGFQLRRESNVTAFLECRMVYGAAFPDQSGYDWARTILQDLSLDETEKMNRISEFQIFGKHATPR